MSKALTRLALALLSATLCARAAGAQTTLEWIVLTLKPEPGFTEPARRFNVTGVVRLRAILHTSGEMRNISVVKGLPHGLTETAVAAARRIRFEPAQKEGRAVSQYVVLEYHYNIY